MNKKIFIAIVLLIFFGSALFSKVLAWDDKVTHKDLSEYAAENSVLDKNKGDYLKNLGFNEGLNEEFKWGETQITIRRWLREGAELEDEGTKWEAFIGVARFNNHFHNPLKTWTSAGLDDTVLGLHYTGESSVIWAQNFDTQQNAVGGNWSWQRVRQSYYDALTAQTEEFRQESFAVTFRGLGHQMHLIEDMGQPDHVRNDAHPEDAMFGKNILNGSRYFETWAKEEFPTLIDLKAFAPAPIFPDVSFNSDDGYIPITRFVDTKQYYNGGIPSTSLSQGLAEYTNANFFSNDTLFAAERYPIGNGHYFPFPRRASTDLQSFINGTKPSETITAEDNTTDKGIWISKTADGEYVEHFARSSFITKFTYNIFGEGNLFYSTFYTDEKCHEDYAKNLLPRAVGYSAGLLNYFFRGKIEITLPDNGIYAQTDNATTGFTRITLLAKNVTPDNEEMTNGSIELVVSYKLAQSDPFQSALVPVDEKFTYRVVPELNNTLSIPRDTPVELTFDLGQNTIIPINATNVYLQLVYKGRLGNEDGAVAVGFQDISEPTPVDLLNNMDKICINGNWYTTGSAEAIAQVDANQDGRAYGVNEWDVYAHDLQNIYARVTRVDDPQYASPTVNNYVVPNLSAGSFTRALYILTDYQYGYSFYKTQVPTDSNDWWGHVPTAALHSGTAIKRQTDYEDGIYTDFYPVFYHFRESDIWWGGGVIFTNEPYPSGSQCDLGLL